MSAVRAGQRLDSLIRRAAVLAAVYEAITVASAVAAAARGMR